MEWLNYHHLHYFWVVAREGGLAPAGKLLRLSHPTLSTQIRALEERLGAPLFAKTGRKRVLTETGQLVYRYAEEIFALGNELLDTVQGRAQGQAVRLDVGVVDVVPKLVVRRLLQPALTLPSPVRLVCHEDTQERLLTELALHTLDIVIADAPVPSGSSVRAFHHLLGETSVSFFAAPRLARSLRRSFPRSLHGAPLLLPIENVPLRRALNLWLQRRGLIPHLVAEFEDSALMKVFGAEGTGAFPAPTVMAREVCKQYGVSLVGHADEVRESFYAISAERRLHNPAVLAILSAARSVLFA